VQELLPQRTGILVIRAWVEGDPPDQLRARITRTFGLERRNEVSTTAATIEEIEQTVHAWLNTFLSS
jgi:hypothetical protein